MLERVFDDNVGLSDSEESDTGGEGVHGYLPMRSLDATIEDDRSDGLGDSSDLGDRDEEDADLQMLVDSEDSSGKPASNKSTIVDI